MNLSDRTSAVPVSEDLEDLYENAPCGYASLDPTGCLVKVNHTFCVWTGFDAQEVLGKKIGEFLSVASHVFYETHFAPLLRMQGFCNEAAFDFVKRDGTKFPVIANAAERRRPDGGLQVTRLVILLATDRRQYERDLLHARDTAERGSKDLADVNVALEEQIAKAVAQQLRAEHGLLAEIEVSELREQFIAVLGHDLRNPLAAITSGARLLTKEPLSPRGHEILGLLKDSARRMSGLIDNVLDFARGRLGGGIGLSLARDPLEPLLGQVVAELQVARPDAVIETHYAITEPVECDRVRLGQLVSNLLGNAITHGASAEPIILDARSAAGQFELSISNRGLPIPAEAMAHLFRPFFRGKVRHSQHGLGLGLHIASEIAKAHRGTLTVSSSPEETRFTLRMPCHHGLGDACLGASPGVNAPTPSM
jgi:sigma-B regulation protein RsbU (phosphoserine phosphatase)